jgi:hypothetical protein
MLLHCWTWTVANVSLLQLLSVCDSPKIWKLLFQQCMAQTVAHYMLQDLNLCIDSLWSFDLMQFGPAHLASFGLACWVWLTSEKPCRIDWWTRQRKRYHSPNGSHTGTSVLALLSFLAMATQVPAIFFTQDQDTFLYVFLP